MPDGEPPRHRLDESARGQPVGERGRHGSGDGVPLLDVPDPGVPARFCAPAGSRGPTTYLTSRTPDPAVFPRLSRPAVTAATVPVGHVAGHEPRVVEKAGGLVPEEVGEVGSGPARIPSTVPVAPLLPQQFLYKHPSILGSVTGLCQGSWTGPRLITPRRSPRCGSR